MQQRAIGGQLLVNRFHSIWLRKTSKECGLARTKFGRLCSVSAIAFYPEWAVLRLEQRVALENDIDFNLTHHGDWILFVAAKHR